MAHLTNPLHTGSLEVFHSLINSYAPKRQEFELNVQDARVKLAILDHNNNVGKQQARVKSTKRGSGKKGAKRWRFVCSKLTKEWVPKPIMEPKSFSFVFKILEEIVERKQAGQKINIKALDVENRLQSPKNIAYTERPSTSTILERYFQRYKK